MAEKKVKKKIEKSCTNCAIQDKLGCSTSKQNKVCPKWIYIKAHCGHCLYVKDCIKINKTVSKEIVCQNFKKNPEGPIDISKVTKTKTEKIKPSIKKAKKKEEPENFSPMDIVESVISSEYDSKVFEQIDDRDIPKSSNPIEFIIDKRFMGIKLFPRQLQIFQEFMGAYCPYCSDTKFLRKKIEVDTPIDEILDRAVYYKNGICKKCKTTRYDAIQDQAHNQYYQLAICAGQRSGKSLSVGVLCGSILHEYLKIPNPVETLKLLPNATLHGTFVGLRVDDAIKNLWEPFHGLITSSPWFKMYHDFLDEEGMRLGVELYRIRDTYIAYPFKRMSLYPAGPDKRKLRGKTRFISSIDEIGWFLGSEGGIKYDVDEVYTALDNSLMTVIGATRKLLPEYPDIPTGYGLYISSPSSKTDKIMRLYKMSLEDKHIYGAKYATWEFNPDLPRDTFDTKYREDPVVAERDFGANPPYSTDPYIRSPAVLLPLFSKRKNLAEIKGKKITKDSLGGHLIYPKIGFKKVHTYPSVLAIDCGWKYNSFACTLMHWFQIRDEVKMAASLIIEVKPDPYPINFPKVYEHVIVPIVENFNVQMLAVDRWQSINLTQQIYAEHEVDAVIRSVNMDDFNDLRTTINSGDIVFPQLEIDEGNLIDLDRDVNVLVEKAPVSHLFLQLLMSKDTGKTVTKGDDMTDDILRTLVLGYSILQDEEYADRFNTEGEETTTKYRDVNSIIVVSGLSNPIKSSTKSVGAGTSIVPGIGCAQTIKGQGGFHAKR